MDDVSSVVQVEFWGPLLEASQQPLVVAWFAFGALILLASAIWVGFAKRKAAKHSARPAIPRTIAGSVAVAEAPIARSA